MAPPNHPANRAPVREPSSPSEIAPGVFVGGWDDAIRFTGTKFCVREEPPEGLPGAIHVPIYDGVEDAPIVENLEVLARRMEQAREGGSPVLVFCGHGVRRGPLGAAWYLHRFSQLTLDEAYDRIRTVRPQVEHAKEWIGHWKPLEE